MPGKNPTQDSALSKHDVRSAAMQARICDAVTRCLEQYGYSETTLARIQAEAGVSRGALMHHFADRHQIIAATAVRLLEQSMRPIQNRKAAGRPTDVRELLLEIWDRVVNTAEGRAMLEVLVACRTDGDLKEALAPKLQDWDRASHASVAELFTGAGLDADDGEVLWSIIRAFVRGLIIHEQFVSSPDYLRRMLLRFADLIDPQLLRKNPEL